MTTASDQYQREQDRFKSRSQATQEDEEEPVLTVPEAPEVRPEVYRDVVPMVFRGFLVQEAEIHGVRLVFKSLNQHELDMVRWVGGYREGKASSAFWVAFLAYSVFVLDGVNVLTDRERWIRKITRTFQDMPQAVKDRIVRHLTELNRRSNVAVLLTEAYAMEKYSRFRWAQVLGMDLCGPSVTGIPGTERIGTNWAQLTWKALNQVEDMSVQLERDWENAKFVGACFAGKGVQKIYNQDIRRRQEEAEDKITRKDRLLQHVLNGESMESVGHVRGGYVVMAPRTAEELAVQLEKDLKGEKDWHDRVVDEHNRRIRDNIRKRQVEMEALLARQAEEVGPQPMWSQTGLDHPLTSEQADAKIQMNRQLMAQSLARIQRTVDSDPALADHAKKWGYLPGEGEPP